MFRPGTLPWFARHEARLAWRDGVSLLTAGRRRRLGTVAAGFAVFALFLHALAYMVLEGTEAPRADDPHVLAIVTAGLLAGGSLMLSQALEAVTRAFHARGDLELILASPAPAARVFAVRLAAVAATIAATALALGAPFINVAAWFGGPRWLAAYAVVAALAAGATAVAAALAVALFRLAGPRRTRIVAQIAAAVIGAAFAIGVQIAAIVAYGSEAGLTIPRHALLERVAPAVDSPLWGPARAAMGDPLALAGLVVAGFGLLAVAIRFLAPLFGSLALATAGEADHAPARRGRGRAGFRTASPARALRRKEWLLLARDPWLLSQTLMQLLYLLPAVFVLWRDLSGLGGGSSLLVPVLILAAGQLGGGLAWLTLSGEDAPDLIAAAPVSAWRVLRAKGEAVLGAIGVLLGPFVAALGFVSPIAAAVSGTGALVAAGSAVAVQHWFRVRGRRGQFRRRQTASRVATVTEALCSAFWAAAGALAALGSWLAVVPGVLVLAILAGAWAISPGRRTEG